MTTRLVGARVQRREDPRLLVGQGRYLDDLGRGALAAAFVRSPHAHARILDIDVTDALDVDGLVAIYTYEDLEATGTRIGEPLPLLIPHPALTAPRTGFPLANGEVNCVGEPVVMVVARDRYWAEDVCDRIRVAYEPLPPVVGVAAARAADRLVHDDVPGNVAAHLVQEVGDVEAALAVDSGDFPASLATLKALVGWDDFEDYRAGARAEGRRVGIGLACYVEGTGVGPYEGGHVHVETSGRVCVSTGLTSQGQGHQTVFAQIVADELGVALEDITVTTGDTRRFGYAVGTFASRAAVMSGNAIALAARKVRTKALRVAGEALEADPRDLEIVEGVVRVRGNPEAGLPLATVAVLANPLRYAFDETAALATQFAVGDASGPPVAEDDEPGLEGRDYYSPTQSTFANGMHAVVVETDPDTAEVRVLRYCVVHDCGPLLNPVIVEGQVHGGVAQGIGGALYERMHYDENGQLLNASFIDFLMPYATEVPPIEIDHLETPSLLNPLGIKGAGRRASSPGRRRSPRPSRTPRVSVSPACRCRPASCGSCAGASRPASSNPCTGAGRRPRPPRRPDEDPR